MGGGAEVQGWEFARRRQSSDRCGGKHYGHGYESDYEEHLGYFARVVLSVCGVLSLFPTDALRVEDLPFLSPKPFLPHTPHFAGGMSRECM